MRFAHLGDTHIRNLKYHKEYREVFKKLYANLKKQKPDFIIHCGDIAHTKTQISPEFVDMCSDFLSNLANIAPTYVILGNHDGNLKNSSRQDALTPIVNALNHSNLYLLKDSGEVLLDDEFAINVLSVFDTDNWQQPSSLDRINIALYHGSVSGVKTDTGWVMEHGENDISIFNNFDYGFLGDIHKTNQSLNESGTIRYCGSTVQQNHGETNDKGYLLWDIDSKDSYTVEHHILENPKPFITIKLTPKGRIPSSASPLDGARLRLVTDNNLPLDVIRKAVDAAKVRFKPEAIAFLNRALGDRSNMLDGGNGLIQEDLRDLAVQERLIREYLDDYQPEDNVLDDVYKMNVKYSSQAEKEEEVSRNINWKLKKLEWNNLFNYGEGNCVCFDNLNGVVGIFGKNFSGKSSIIDSLLYIVFNTTSKNNRKNLNVINQNSQSCSGTAEIDIGTKTYVVERSSQKYIKKLKGNETEEAKTDVDFYVIDNAIGETTSLNGTTRNETDKNIRKVFGTIEDFFMTSMASQLESLAFINEGSTNRKQILAKFLDLEIFEKKFKKAKEDSVDIKSALKKLSDRDFEEEKKVARTELARQETELSVKDRERSDLEKTIADLKIQIGSVEEKINSIPAELIDIKKVKEDLHKCTELVEQCTEQDNKLKENLSDNQETLSKVENFLGNINIEDIRTKKKNLDELEEEVQRIETEIKDLQQKNKLSEQRIEDLKSIPCGEKFISKCAFITSAYRATERIKASTIGINQLSVGKKVKQKKIDDLNPKRIYDHLDKYEQISEKRVEIQNRVNLLMLDLEKNKNKLIQATNLKQELQSKLDEYEEKQDAIETLESLLKDKKSLQSQAQKLEQQCSLCKSDVLNLYKTTGSLEEKLKHIIDAEQEFNDLETEYTVSDLYMRCMHPNGISYDIIKKRLPIINEEISKILTNIVDFEIFFENDDKKLDILIKHPSHDPRPIEMGSGAEKTIAAMAIRLALLNVSTLPKSDVFILDEPGTALDAENMEGFTRILDMVKAHFKTILLISHLDSLKDAVDRQIIIEKLEGRAHVNEA